MNLRGEFQPPSSEGHRYTLTVICMLTDYTWCIPLYAKEASEVVQGYIEHVYSKFGGSVKILKILEVENTQEPAEDTDMGKGHKPSSPQKRPPPDADPFSMDEEMTEEQRQQLLDELAEKDASVRRER